MLLLYNIIYIYHEVKYFVCWHLSDCTWVILTKQYIFLSQSYIR